MIRTGAALALANRWRDSGRPRLLPINVTVSATFRCNFRCATCNVYERKVTELTPDEWARVFDSLGRAPAWLTFSGGEPFLKHGLVDLIAHAMDVCRPAVVNIPTNGWFTDRVLAGVEELCRAHPATQLVLNCSLDHHVPAAHDRIRGAAGSWERMMATLAGLRALDLANLTIGVHTVVSRANQDDFPAVAEGLARLDADSWIAECAEERVELGTIDSGITPDADRFAAAAEAVLEAERRARGVTARLARTLRVEYYRRVVRFLNGDAGAMPRCHAGFLSCQIGADGEVWSCCVLARRLGDLREHDLDFRRVWFSEEAEAFRSWMRTRRCACPLANAAYTNLLAERPAAARLVRGLVRRVPETAVPVPAGPPPPAPADAHAVGVSAPAGHQFVQPGPNAP